MKSLTSAELAAVSNAVEALDEIALKYGANVTGTLYAAGTSFDVEYDESLDRHGIFMRTDNPVELPQVRV